MLLQRRNSLRHLLCALIVMVAFTAGPTAAHAQDAAVDFSRIGHRATADVLGYRTGDSCDHEDLASDCVFISPAGIEYIVFDGYICGINASEALLTSDVRLPYGLRFGDAKHVAAAKLDEQQAHLPRARRVGGGWGQRDGQEFYASFAGFFGDPDMLTSLHLWFDEAGRLTKVGSHAICV
jgi:hypothetical protein